MPDAPPPAIEARGLRKLYGAVLAVDGIDFAVRAGECFGFLGPNGAGKTSTMRMIYRAARPSGGLLRVLGEDATAAEHDRAVKRSLGVVPQEDNLDQELTLRENLEVMSRFYGLPRAAAHARIAELLGFFELAEKADAPVEHLSGGMKRRALIARALLHDPRILVLDEPTTGLDPQARHHLWDRLRALRRRGATLLLTTHYMDEAERLCDRLVIMDRGKIVAEGTPRELIERNCPPHVVEVLLPEEGAPAAALDELRGAAERTETLADRVLLYARDGEDLVRRATRALPGASALVRRATLEDVFLTITGRRLED
jgi:lipooligosaccharide transport system ATP-binding protein